MTTMPPKPTTFTVVIPTYNREAFIDKAIRSVLKQTCTDWKLLIMDDASTDQTYEKVAPISQILASSISGWRRTPAFPR